MNKAKATGTMLSFLLTVLLFASCVHAQIITATPFILNFNNGESFNVQDNLRGAFVNFTVTSGTVQGTGILNVNATSGELIIVNTNLCSLAIDYNPALLVVTVNNAPFNLQITMIPSGYYSIKWVSASPPIVISGKGQQYYFRSDLYTTYNYTAYGFDSSFTNTNTTLSLNTTATTVTYGYQVWIHHLSGADTELTSGAPTANITLTNPSTGFHQTTWGCPGYPIMLGYDSIRIGIYISINSGAWISIANYISPVIISNQLEASTWTFNLYATYNGAQTTIQFGNKDYKSGVSGITFQKPNENDIQTWRWNSGDYIGFILGGYVDIIGPGAYIIVLLAFFGSLWLRHRNFGSIIFLVIIFAGAGGTSIWIFIPPVAAAVFDIFILIAGAALIWKVIH
jgi:hypothetical protein